MNPVPIPASAPTALYAVYIVVSLVLTGLLAATLYRNGKLFLRDVFDDKPSMADALNHLLVVGFFMLNAGYALLIFRGNDPQAVARPTDFAMDRLGLLLVTLGVIHFVNMAVFWKIRNRAQIAHMPPPVAPQVRVPPRAPRPMGAAAHAMSAAPEPATWAANPPPVQWDRPRTAG